MNDELNRETFNHLVKLAALDLAEDEGEYLRRELNSQLKSIHELESIPLDKDISTTSHGVPYPDTRRPDLRADEWIPYSESERIIDQAPDEQDGYIVVPEIPHTDLD